MRSTFVVQQRDGRDWSWRTVTGQHTHAAATALADQLQYESGHHGLGVGSHPELVLRPEPVFLPAPRGNVRQTDLREVYQRDELFMRLRNADALLGKCGRCRFRAICGGSRSRAFASTGAVMASDPLCVYEPGQEIEPLVAHA